MIICCWHTWLPEFHEVHSTSRPQLLLSRCSAATLHVWEHMLPAYVPVYLLHM